MKEYTREEILKGLEEAPHNRGVNIMGVAESYYNKFYLLKDFLLEDEINAEELSTEELNRLLALADFAGEAFF